MNDSMQTLPELIDEMCEELRKIGYAEATVHGIKVKCLRLVRYAKENGLDNTFSLELVDRFLRDRYHYPYPPDEKLPEQTQDIATQMRKLINYKLYGTAFYNKKPIFPDYPVIFKVEMENFLIHLEKGDYSIGTKKRAVKSVSEFVKFLDSNGIRKLSLITGKHIAEFTSTLYRYAPRTIGVELYNLRLFLRFLHLDEIHDKDMSLLVPKVSCKETLRLPTVWNKEEIERILSCVDRGNATGQRDYAIMLLIAKLGLRNSDVCNLKIDDINWDTSIIEFVQVKTKREVRLPLPEEVGLEIINYLKFGRPKSTSPYLFIRHIPPHGKLKSFSHIMSNTLRHAGFKLPPDKLHGLHTLRHTLASRLLEEKVPINVIGDILGHTSMDSTKPYLRIDMKALRDCAIDPDEVMRDAAQA